MQLEEDTRLSEARATVITQLAIAVTLEPRPEASGAQNERPLWPSRQLRPRRLSRCALITKRPRIGLNRSFNQLSRLGELLVEVRVHDVRAEAADIEGRQRRT